MLFAASAGFAQTTDWYVVGEGDEMRVIGGDSTDGIVILGDDTYAVPADCPEGSFYWSAENVLTACGEGGASFDLVEPEAGATLSTGDAFPEGSMMLQERQEELMDQNNQSNDD